MIHRDADDRTGCFLRRLRFEPVLLYVWAFVMGAASCFIYIPVLTSVSDGFPCAEVWW